MLRQDNPRRKSPQVKTPIVNWAWLFLVVGLATITGVVVYLYPQAGVALSVALAVVGTGVAIVAVHRAP